MTSKNLESFIEHYVINLREFGELGEAVIKKYNLAYIEFLMKQAELLKRECDKLRQGRIIQSVKLDKSKFSRELARQDKRFLEKLRSYKRIKPVKKKPLSKMKLSMTQTVKQVKTRDKEIVKQQNAYNKLKSDLELKVTISPRDDITESYENLKQLSKNLPDEYVKKHPCPSIDEYNQRRYSALYRSYNMYKNCGSSESTRKIVAEMVKLYVKLPLKFRNKNNAPPKSSRKSNTCN